MSTPASSSGNTVPQQDHPYKVLAIYKFASLPDAEAIKAPLAEFCCARGIKGTLILAPEGINGTVAGRPEAIDALSDYLFVSGPFGSRLEGAEAKYSFADSEPFLRMKVRLKPEIVTLRAPQVDPNREVGTYVEPEDWNALIERNDVILVDTRNDYEVDIGTFQRAIDPKTDSFVEFKDYVAKNLDPKQHKKVAMFCTGGIRCEKASSYMLSQGFEEVFHLKGGILKYLEVTPKEESRFNGECFVFDERVSVGHGLEIGTATLCRSCRHPLNDKDRAHEHYVEGVSCAHCINDEGKRQAATERQHQIDLAAKRGLAHMGDAAVEAARKSRELKKQRAEESRQLNAKAAAKAAAK